jgi:hypothetical protein
MRKLAFIIISIFFSINCFSQGEITGTVEDWSLKRPVMNANWDTTFKKTASWITPEMFGAVGDGITNDSAALQNCFNSGKNIEFGKDKHYICQGRRLIFSGGEIDFNNSTLEFTFNGAELSAGLQLDGGQQGSSYLVSADLARGDNVIRVSDANFFTLLRRGDIVNVRDTTKFNLESGETPVSGEIMEVVDVDSVNGIVYTSSKFEDTYLVSDEAEVAKFTVSTFYIHDGTIIQNRDKPITGGDDSNYAMQLSFSTSSIIENMKSVGAKYSGLQISNSYNPTVLNQITTGADQEGAGYGCDITSAVKGAYIDNLRGYQIRHAVANTGGSRGVPWNTIAVNCHGYSNQNTHVFDAHAAVGRVTYENCHAFLGVDVGDTAVFYGVWDVATAYILGDIVSYNNALYESIASTTGDNPETSANWIRYYSGAFGFMMNGRYGNIINCHVNNASYMFTAGYNIENLVIDGFFGENITEGIFIQTNAGIKRGYINNVVVKNSARKANDYLFRIVNAGMDSTILGRFSGYNTGGIKLSNPLSSLNFESIKCAGQILDVSSFSTSIDIAINNLEFLDLENQATGIARLDETNLNSLTINNYTARNCGYGYQFFVDANLENLTIHNANLFFESTQPFIFVGSGDVLTNCLVGNAANLGSVSGRIGTNAGTIDKYKGGALLGTWVYEWSTNQPTLEILQGEFNAPRYSRGSGSPEGTVGADPGSSYLNSAGGASTTLYIKESGTSATGWVAK